MRLEFSNIRAGRSSCPSPACRPRASPSHPVEGFLTRTQAESLRTLTLSVNDFCYDGETDGESRDRYFGVLNVSTAVAAGMPTVAVIVVGMACAWCLPQSRFSCDHSPWSTVNRQACFGRLSGLCPCLPLDFLPLAVGREVVCAHEQQQTSQIAQSVCVVATHTRTECCFLPISHHFPACLANLQTQFVWWSLGCDYAVAVEGTPQHCREICGLNTTCTSRSSRTPPASQASSSTCPSSTQTSVPFPCRGPGASTGSPTVPQT